MSDHKVTDKQAGYPECPKCKSKRIEARTNLTATDTKTDNFVVGYRCQRCGNEYVKGQKVVNKKVKVVVSVKKVIDKIVKKAINKTVKKVKKNYFKNK